ncbi:MAG: T9SS type A sorting domain-containing protein, partial [Taibaiella sp.]|nr:T9SS type A sorting domain-containing protein [Taibaiella sp.]
IGFYPARQVKWVPYDKGYYAETKVKRLSEFWLNEGGPTHNFPLTVDYLNFVAIKKGTDVQVYWQSMIDTAVNRYVLERSTDGIKFATVNDTAASHQDIATYSITKPGEFQTADILYYRLKWTMTGRATTYYSPVRVLRFNDTENNALTLEAHMAGPDVAMVSWISFIDGIADHYILERQINGRTFDTVNTSRSYRHYGQQYNVIDAPAGVSRGALIKYRLTAVLQDGSNIVPPTQVLEWAVPNSVTSVYPNPSTDGILNMVWYAQPGTEIEFSLTDVTGKNMFATSATAAQYKNTTTIYTGFKPKGIYILRSVISGQKYTQKVVFE